LARTRLLLHLVDVAPAEGEGDPAADARAVGAELDKFGQGLPERERWLVLNKIDLLDPKARKARCDTITDALKWRGPVFRISAATGEGCEALCQSIAAHLESRE
jgi:GTP-binding protein